MKLKYLIYMVLLLLPSLASCSDDKKIIFFLGCDDPEISSDIEISIEGIKNFALKNDIVLIEDEKSSKCGYQLVTGKNVIDIESAQTDVDLMMLCKDAFKIK